MCMQRTFYVLIFLYYSGINFELFLFARCWYCCCHYDVIHVFNRNTFVQTEITGIQNWIS